MSNKCSSNLFMRAAKACTAILTAIALNSCGGGGGDADDISTHPAPQTLNGLVITLWSGGPSFTFVRISGSALNGGTETGGFVYNTSGIEPSALPDPVGFTAVDEVDNAVYSYQKINAEIGEIIVQGDASSGDLYPAGTFERRYRVTFLTTGTIVTGLSVVDNDDGGSGPAVPVDEPWLTGNVRHYDGGPLDVGYSLDESESRLLPFLYPSRLVNVDSQRLELTPIAPATEAPIYVFAASDFIETQVLSDPVIFEQTGRGTAFDLPTTPINYTFEYEPDITTVNEVRIRIVLDAPDGRTIDYDLVFSSKNSGDYTASNGDTGRFLFPNIDNTGS